MEVRADREAIFKGRSVRQLDFNPLKAESKGSAFLVSSGSPYHCPGERKTVGLASTSHHPTKKVWLCAMKVFSNAR